MGGRVHRCCISANCSGSVEIEINSMSFSENLWSRRAMPVALKDANPHALKSLIVWSSDLLNNWRHDMNFMSRVPCRFVAHEATVVVINIIGAINIPIILQAPFALQHIIIFRWAHFGVNDARTAYQFSSRTLISDAHSRQLEALSQCNKYYAWLSRRKLRCASVSRENGSLRCLCYWGCVRNAQLSMRFAVLQSRSQHVYFSRLSHCRSLSIFSLHWIVGYIFAASLCIRSELRFCFLFSKSKFIACTL